MKLKIMALAITVTLFASPVLANTVVDTYPLWDGNRTSGWFFTVQTFTAPADNVLLNWQFGITPRTSDGGLTFSIYAWSGSSQVGSALYSVNAPWTTTSTDILISGINLPLSSGGLYGAVIDLQVYSGQSVQFIGSNVYAGGNAFWSDDGLSWSFYDYDHRFRAEFGGGAPVPLPSALLLLGPGLVALAAIRRRFTK